MSKSKQFRYMLRRTLPLWKPEESIEEVINYCINNDLDEVAFKVDAEDFNHGLITVDILMQYYPWLEKARDRLNKNGITFSINPWVTICHNDRGRDMEKVHPGMQHLVDWTGAQNKVSGCPESPHWRKWISEIYKIYASLNPDVLWIEDDIRTFNHPPTSHGCFCPLHLRRFSNIVGEEVTREQVVAAILKKGKPHPWRALWLDMMGTSMVEVANLLEESVHSVNKDITMGLMFSGIDEHSMEGRKWDEFVGALSKGKTMVVRPTLGEYRDCLVREYIGYFNLHRKCAATIPGDPIIAPELENFLYSRFNKSNKITRMQLLLCGMMGYKAVFMNLYDHVGTSVDLEPEMGQLLKDSKPILEYFSDNECDIVQEFGILNHHSYRGPAFKVLGEGAKYADMKTRTTLWMDMLQAIGMPTVFQREMDLTQKKTRAFTDQAFREMSHEDIMSLLSSSLMLDGSAAYTLMDMGYGEYLGVNISVKCLNKDVSADTEEFVNSHFGGGSGEKSSLNYVISKAIFSMKKCDTAIEISRILTKDGAFISTGMTIFKNSLGGRVCVTCADFSKGIEYSFIDRQRCEMLAAVALYMTDGEDYLRITNVPYIYSLYRDYGDYRYIGLINLSHDDADKLVFDISVPKGSELANVRFMDGENGWQSGKLETLGRKAINDEIDLLQVCKNNRLNAMDLCAIKFGLL